MVNCNCIPTEKSIPVRYLKQEPKTQTTKHIPKKYQTKREPKKVEKLGGVMYTKFFFGDKNLTRKFSELEMHLARGHETRPPEPETMEISVPEDYMNSTSFDPGTPNH